MNFTKEQLVSATIDAKSKMKVYENLGYSSRSNSNTAKKINEHYEKHGLNIDELIDANIFEYKQCPVCNESFRVSIVTDKKKPKVTCSHACSNTLFRSGADNGSHKKAIKNSTDGKIAHSVTYRTLCFTNHEKKCVVCGEDKIVAVHHNDHNHHNNELSNLIPLCPTHHQYVHSRYKDEVQPIIDEYIEAWKKK